MFLPNLQKNIQELERQISRLETECEHMGRRETTPTSPPNTQSTVKESADQPFITGPSVSTTTYSVKMLNLNTGNMGGSVTPRQSQKSADGESVRLNHSARPQEKKSRTNFGSPREETRCCLRKFHEKGIHHPTGDQKRCDREGRSPCKRLAQSVKDAPVTSDENRFSHLEVVTKNRNKLKETTPKDQVWCELFLEQPSNAKCPHKVNLKEFKDPALAEKKEEKRSSDEESCEGKSPLGGNGQGSVDGEEEVTPRSKRRSRSARTKKNFPEDLRPVKELISKPLQEKETQCLLWNEEKGRGEFFLNVNESIKVLQGLIEELKKKTSQERRNHVLTDMQNTLNKITEVKGTQALPLLTEETGLRLPEGAENITNMKKALCAVKKICEELAEEKTALSEEVAVKNVALSNLKTKEKEYLAVIANLKHNAEKLKEAAEEGTRAKRELKILTVKLQEEAKVIEALKKSHEKMQEIVENYVLENDKLKAHVRIIKLESQKYNVLLAGKEAEIVKYKREIESFQRQITEQLNLLRSRAAETEVQHTVEAINQASALQNEAPTVPQATPASSSTKIKTCRNKEPPPFDFASKKDWDSESKPSVSSNGTQKRGAVAGAGGSRASEPENLKWFDDMLSNSGNLRDSINELLEDIKRESSDVYWLSATNSWMASARSTSNLSTSEDASDASHKE